MVLAHGNAPRSIGYQPIALLLSYTRIIGGERRTCASTGLAGPAGFETVSAPRRIHSPEKWRRAVVLPHRPGGPNRLPTDHRASRFYSPKIGGGERSCSPAAVPPDPFQADADASVSFASEVPAAGIAPAWIRLEGGGLSFSATRRNWTSRRDSHPQHGVRSTA